MTALNALRPTKAGDPAGTRGADRKLESRRSPAETAIDLAKVDRSRSWSDIIAESLIETGTSPKKCSSSRHSLD